MDGTPSFAEVSDARTLWEDLGRSKVVIRQDLKEFSIFDLAKVSLHKGCSHPDISARRGGGGVPPALGIPCCSAV